jgi:hypothetical protein
MAIAAHSGIAASQVLALPPAGDNAGVVLRQGGKVWVSNGTAWVDITTAPARRVNPVLSYVGALAPNLYLDTYTAAEPFTLPAGLPGSFASLLVAGTSAFDLHIGDKNGYIALLSFAANSKTGVFSGMATDVSFAAGDQVIVYTLGTVGTPALGLSITLVSNLVAVSSVSLGVVPATITVPWAPGGGRLDYDQIIAVPGVTATSRLAINLAAVPDVDDNDVEEMGSALFSASYAAPGQVRVSASFPAPVCGAINFLLTVI